MPDPEGAGEVEGAAVVTCCKVEERVGREEGPANAL